MENLIKAVNKVMEECENVDKGLTVGSGNYSYKGVADKDVKLIINRSMRKHGLAIFPVSIHEEETISENVDNYGKVKRSVFVKVKTKYKLYHTSGESIELEGYGHGIDTADKACGKATTYALKYTLLYTFLVATGQIDDTDNTHSEEIKQPVKQAPKQPVKQAPKQPAKKVEKPFIKDETDKAEELKEAIIKGFKVTDILTKYRLQTVLETKLKRLENEVAEMNK